MRSLRTPLGWKPILYGWPRDRLAVKLGVGVWFRLDVLPASLLELLAVLAFNGVLLVPVGALGAGEPLGDGDENTRWGCGCCNCGPGWGCEVDCDSMDVDAALPLRWWLRSRGAYVVGIGC